MRVERDFVITYFKHGGKYYTEAIATIEVDVDEFGTPYMPQAFDYVRSASENGKLPGLQSGRWEGPILVNHEDGYPGLIL